MISFGEKRTAAAAPVPPFTIWDDSDGGLPPNERLPYEEEGGFADLDQVVEWLDLQYEAIAMLLAGGDRTVADSGFLITDSVGNEFTYDGAGVLDGAGDYVR